MPPARKKKAEPVPEAAPPAPPPEQDPDSQYERIIPGSSEWDPMRIIIKPREQLQLTEKELAEETTMVLRADNPQAPHNIVRFSHKEKCFKLDPAVDQLEVHFAQEGHLLHLTSDEAKKQKDRDDEEKASLAREMERKKAEGTDDGEDATGLRNQFNFSERASQTLNNARRERGTMTEPPPSVEYSGQCTQWEMFDAYMEDIERRKEAEAKKGKKDKKEGTREKEDGVPGTAKEESKDNIVHSAAMAHAAKILERMANQNTFADVTEDFKFWEDASDTFRDEGTLLPLWKFSYDKAKKKHVTAVRWNPEFADLFAVGYGSYDFMKQGTGMLCLFSLKNPSWPEFSCTTPTGVMCVDWHPQHSSVLCVGLYDGTVCVYDVRSKSMAPIYQSTVKSGKHTDPVWEVCWQEEDLAKNLNFFSISSDGRVTLWTLAKSELECSDLMQLKLEPGASLMGKQSNEMEEEDASLMGLAGGCCFDFSKLSEHLFLVGTEEGAIHKCSKAYNSEYLATYTGHYMAVYTVRWNLFHPKIFASCSADWTVKLWDHTTKTALMSFDLNLQVGDLAWSPWSSTTFAACTADGKVHVFDLNENKNEPYCEQKVARKSKLTKVAFNPRADTPVIMVGDDHGTVVALKPSPNLRWTAVSKAEAERKAKEEAEAASGPRRGAPKKSDAGDGEVKKDPRELEMEKAERILEMAHKNQIE
ncbi:hypothetical protein AB1Y20_011866 [Prymnesium parvum]|uniref:Dynein intermediate chain n=1 Tax=Prymnesium parvum TaxID=97485 RepID=A0AB34IHQ3_PRYPA